MAGAPAEELWLQEPVPRPSGVTACHRALGRRPLLWKSADGSRFCETQSPERTVTPPSRPQAESTLWLGPRAAAWGHAARPGPAGWGALRRAGRRAPTWTRVFASSSSSGDTLRLPGLEAGGRACRTRRDSRAPGPGQLQAMASLNQKPSPPLRGLFLMTQPRRPDVPTGSGATAGSPRLGQEGPNFPDNRKVQVEMPLKTGPFQCGGGREGWSTPEVCEAARPGRSEGHKRPKKQS